MEAPVKDAADQSSDRGTDGSNQAANDSSDANDQTDDQAKKATRYAHPDGKSEYDQYNKNKGSGASRFHRFEFGEAIPKIVQ
jgi:hypothetical protein